MTLNIILLLIFLFAMVIVALLYRNSTLEKLPPLEGETVLFEEKGVRVEQRGAPRTAVFINCLVRVSDRRIVIAQKMLLSKSHALRHVINYAGQHNETDIKSTLKKGYLNITLRKQDIKITDSSEGCMIEMDIPHSVLTGNQYIAFRTSMREEFVKLHQC